MLIRDYKFGESKTILEVNEMKVLVFCTNVDAAMAIQKS